VVDLDKLLKIVVAIILIDVPGLEFIWPDNLPERWSQSMKITLPDEATSHAGERHGGVGDLAL
jgi:hypothetical protein